MLYVVPGFSKASKILIAIIVQSLFHEGFNSWIQFTKENITSNSCSNFKEEYDGQQESELHIKIFVNL